MEQFSEKEKIWLKNTFFPIIQDAPGEEIYSWNIAGADWTDEKRAPFIKMNEAIKNKSWDEQDELDTALNKIASIEYSNAYCGSNVPNSILFTFSPEQIAMILAKMCKMRNIYWDNTIHTSYELDYFKKTIFGKALWDVGCFVNQPKQQTQVNQPSTTQNSTNTTQNSSTSTVSNTQTLAGSRKAQQPRNTTNNFRSRGPLSQFARGLVQAPHQKEQAGNALVYRIVDHGNKKSNKECRAYVRPLDSKGKAPSNPSLNKVFVGTTHVYGYLDCYFEDKSEATAFMNALQSSWPVGTLSLWPVSTNPNGYFTLKTEYGNVRVRAADLNEELLEELKSMLEAVETNDEINEDFDSINVKPVKKLDRYTLEQVMIYNRD